MKQSLPYLFLLTFWMNFAQVPCENGSANGFPCESFDLLARMTPNDLDAAFANDSWGWTDVQEGKEYAIVGLNNGTAFIDISQPTAPIYLGKLPTQTENSTWRDIKVYNNHAFIVSEANDHGMQIFDLTQLRDVSSPPEVFTNTAYYDDFGSAHNLVINEDSGYAYAVGTSTFNGGPHFIDIQDPLSPMAAGGYAMADYSHDAQVVTYNGPDSDYSGREILIGSNTDEVVIVDITDKTTPVEISSIQYSDVGYTHQGWFTDDQRYFLLGDEFDEFNVGFNSRTIIFDFQDLDNPLSHFEYFGNTSAVDHNGYVVGDRFYLANYQAGLRVMDLTDIDNQTMTEIGYFDTYQPNDDAGFGGAWNVFPFFDSRVIMISGTEGLTLVRDENELAVPENIINPFSIAPNPASDHVQIQSKTQAITAIKVYNILGQEILNKTYRSTNQLTLDVSNWKSGIYLLRINNTSNHKLIIRP
ncbi:MAG: choice-of-anchor B family protein [Flavobacteriaceae bacterium]|nr:choice-of-anchor B family protein [Flavobacteriaceae bacterium]